MRGVREVRGVEVGVRNYADAKRIMKGVEEMVVDVWVKSKVKKEYRDIILDGMKNVMDILTEMEIENAELRGRVMERGMIMKEVLSVVVERSVEGQGTDEVVTFAEVAKGVKKGSGKLEVVISHEEKDSEDIRKDILEMDPKAMNVRVERMMKTRKGLVVAVREKEYFAKLKASEAFKGRGYKVVEKERKRPMVLLYDVEKGLSEDQVLKELFVKNFGGVGMTEQEFLRDVKVRRKVSQARQRGEKEKCRESWVMEVSGKIFRVCMTRNRLYVEWESMKVKEYIDVLDVLNVKALDILGGYVEMRNRLVGGVQRNIKRRVVKLMMKM